MKHEEIKFDQNSIPKAAAAQEASAAGSKGVATAEGPGAGAIASVDTATFWNNAATTTAANTATFIFNAILIILNSFFWCLSDFC